MRVDETLLDHIRETVGFAADPAGARIVVAMSGGVDSSVAAGLLKFAGYDVAGITLQLYDHGAAVRNPRSCCAGQDIHDARRAAAVLGIPHYVLDFESRFHEAVVTRFVDSYLAGETPIPCVTCNQTVKFADLLGRSRDLGARALVTGHYIVSHARHDGSGHRDLFTPVDMERDQSYFLFATTQEQIDYLRFPLGGLPKPETRRLAAAMGLQVATKPDSQDICFVPEGRYTDVIRKIRPEACEPGQIVHTDGRVLGRHTGVSGFTVGQRRGLGVADGAPLYVVKIEAAQRRVIVGPKDALLCRYIELREPNWLGAKDAMSGTEELPVYVKIRSTRPAVPASVRFPGGKALVRLGEGEHGVSPGQACVFYEGAGAGARVLGGGVIAATHGDDQLQGNEGDEFLRGPKPNRFTQSARDEFA